MFLWTTRYQYSSRIIIHVLFNSDDMCTSNKYFVFNRETITLESDCWKSRTADVVRCRVAISNLIYRVFPLVKRVFEIGTTQ